MEILVNCNIMIDIEMIDNIQGGNQSYEIFFSSKDKSKYKIVFDSVWDLRCSIENAYIDRFSKFCHNEEQESSVLLIQNSDYIQYFEKQVSGTRPVSGLKDYILFDSVDTVMEILTLKEPILVKLS
ncbi:MAG: hypothetical protein HDR19_02585 [Lachnospiraceae bacterium]|nr:hypothetical protein [Lachnospiraceae bacterium]